MTKRKIDISILIISALWVFVQSGLLIKNGIVTTGESIKYISEADIFLTTGQLSSSNYWFYSVEIFLILIDKLAGAEMILVLIVQLLLNLLATLYFYKTAKNLFPGNQALIATVLFLLNYPFHEFNTFAQTESLYYSLSIILSCYLIKLPCLNVKNCLVIIACIFILTITRPTGILFMIPVALYLALRFGRHVHPSAIIATGIVTIFFFIVILSIALGSGGQLDFMLPFKTNQVLCGIPKESYKTIKIIEKGNSIYGLVYYVSHNTGQFTRLALEKSLSFLGLIRSYFSYWHNLFLIVFYYPLYLFVICGLKKWIKEYPSISIYFFTVILTTWTTTILTCDDWHNRFFLSISTYLILLGVPAIVKLIEVISSGTFYRIRC